jgi:hypothetical protein
MTKLDLVRAKCAFCYLIFASNEANARPEREVPPLLHMWEMRELGYPETVIANKGGTNLDHRSCPGCLEYAHLGCSSSLSWWWRKCRCRE